MACPRHTTASRRVRRLGGGAFSTSAAESGYLVDDPDDPSRKLIRQILGAVSEYERAMIPLRLRSGRHRKAKHGGFAYGAAARV
jgi:DNA invertase Pin-like site-specific DNA recombinase